MVFSGWFSGLWQCLISYHETYLHHLTGQNSFVVEFQQPGNNLLKCSEPSRTLRTNVIFICDRDKHIPIGPGSLVTKLPYDSIDERDACERNVTVKYDGACGSSSPVTSSGGLSTGSVLLILFFVALLIYFVGGVLVNRNNGAQGVEMIPHLQFWKELPSLIVVGSSPRGWWRPPSLDVPVEICSTHFESSADTFEWFLRFSLQAGSWDVARRAEKRVAQRTLQCRRVVRQLRPRVTTVKVNIGLVTPRSNLIPGHNIGTSQPTPSRKDSESVTVTPRFTIQSVILRGVRFLRPTGHLSNWTHGEFLRQHMKTPWDKAARLNTTGRGAELCRTSEIKVHCNFFSTDLEVFLCTAFIGSFWPRNLAAELQLSALMRQCDRCCPTYSKMLHGSMSHMRPTFFS
ncbi:hypothetical protein HPB51_006405 [Rhipicephalus microplus]|uniref:Autophagy-related protein 27 n=1 Tax=Rhipicephalus microplus TaxID=6941 RepID=A0A9J6EYL4_RHIMP|nr:hypothetical protein HPB51_006405 [Rhipicephalus microplus]